MSFFAWRPMRIDQHSIKPGRPLRATHRVFTLARRSRFGRGAEAGQATRGPAVGEPAHVATISDRIVVPDLSMLTPGIVHTSPIKVAKRGSSPGPLNSVSMTSDPRLSTS